MGGIFMEDKDFDKEFENILEEQKDEKEELSEESEKQPEEKEIKVSKPFLYMLFAIAAFAILIITKIFVNFGVYHPVIHGIICLIVYCISGAGAILAFLQEKKPNPEFYANGFALILALLCL